MPIASPASLLSLIRGRRGAIAVVGALAIAVLTYILATVRPLALPVALPETDVTIRVFGLGTVEAQVLSKVGFEVGATVGPKPVVSAFVIRATVGRFREVSVRDAPKRLSGHLNPADIDPQPMCLSWHRLRSSGATRSFRIAGDDF